MSTNNYEEKYAVAQYIIIYGLERILEICDYNLRVVINHLRRECKTSKKTNLYNHIQKFKRYLNDRIYRKHGKNVDLVDNFLKEKFRKEK